MSHMDPLDRPPIASRLADARHEHFDSDFFRYRTYEAVGVWLVVYIAATYAIGPRFSALIGIGAAVGYFACRTHQAIPATVYPYLGFVVAPILVCIIWAS